MSLPPSHNPPYNLLLLSPGDLYLLHPGHLRSGILQPQMGVYVHGDAYVRMPHQVLQRLRVHPGFGLIVVPSISYPGSSAPSAMHSSISFLDIRFYKIQSLLIHIGSADILNNNSWMQQLIKWYIFFPVVFINLGNMSLIPYLVTNIPD